MKRVIIIGWLFGAILQVHAQGYIVPNGVTYAGLNFFGGYEIRVRQNPANSDYTGFWLIPRGKTPPTSLVTNTFSFEGYLDEGVRAFLVASNQPVSQHAIQSGSYTEFLYPNSYVLHSGSTTYYVGLYTGYNPFVIVDGMPIYTGIYENPLFGWAKLRNNQGVIELLDSALAYDVQGIFAGTLNFVPEPSGFALATLGTLLVGWRRRNSSR